MSTSLNHLKDAWEYAVYCLLRLVPVDAASAIGSFLVRVNVRRSRPRIIEGAKRNLALHRPQWTEAQIESGVYNFLDNVGRFMAEFATLHRLLGKGRVTVEGAEHLLPCVGKVPILALALHTGNWEVMGIGLRKIGVRFATFYEPPESAVQRRIAITTREALGFQLLTPDKVGLRQAMGLLTQKKPVAIFADEAKDGRAMAPLFGRPPHKKGNLSIAARLARQFDCTLFVAHIERVEGCRFVMRIGKPCRLPNGDGRTILDDVAYLNELIEPIVLANIDCWYFLDDSIDAIE
ncbi:lysophospholipid acyltransferase family protein [Rhizobium sp. RAF56]|uniref:lysophospholipid acyltransferase family protein n=1 Tax=Rhizobium sp. RAF56 TaxID=3233062 RepID=UPI003F9A1810